VILPLSRLAYIAFDAGKGSVAAVFFRSAIVGSAWSCWPMLREVLEDRCTQEAFGRADGTETPEGGEGRGKARNASRKKSGRRFGRFGTFK